jgi:hypothetical protein
MAASELIASARAGDFAGVDASLRDGADADVRDENGWSALSWAAAGGHARIVRLLIEHGADVFAAADDRRTPYQIALAAGRADVARLLSQAEADHGAPAVAASSGQAAQRPYCRAYTLGDLRRFPDWSEAGGGDLPDGEPLVDDSVLFLHRDLSVTRSVWPEDVVFRSDSAAWRCFCEADLGFQPPDDLAWLPSSPTVGGE